MRLSSVLIFVRFLLLFIVRRIIKRGVMRQPAVRWLAVAVALGAFILSCLLSIAVLRQLFDGPESLVLLLRAAGISTFFWVMVAYTIVRVLFLKSGELIEASFVLPVTNKERTLWRLPSSKRRSSLSRCACLSVGSLSRVSRSSARAPWSRFSSE